VPTATKSHFDKVLGQALHAKSTADFHRKAIVMARKKRPAAVVEEVEYEKQPWNVYSMMLLLSMIAIIIGCIFLTLELKAYDWKLDAKASADHLVGNVPTIVSADGNDALA
jgi:hypothetical protein